MDRRNFLSGLAGLVGMLTLPARRLLGRDITADVEPKRTVHLTTRQVGKSTASLRRFIVAYGFYTWKYPNADDDLEAWEAKDPYVSICVKNVFKNGQFFSMERMIQIRNRDSWWDVLHAMQELEGCGLRPVETQMVEDLIVQAREKLAWT
jgi:hypothetical protein